ncbi:MAG: STY0301 family protein [Rhodospirillaceae bacterium]|nr:STY0301 family protein [Rhodospirillaceae bacterium]
MRVRIMARVAAGLPLGVLMGIFALAWPASGQADGAEVTCPAEIEVVQELREPQTEWAEGAEPWPSELVNLAVFDGPPEELFQLIHDEESEDGDTAMIAWDLVANEGRGYWITCHYANTLVTLTRALPMSVARCEVVFETQMRYADGREVVRSMRCF